MELPIDVISGTNPTKFRWKFVVDTPGGKQVVDCDGSLPASVERAVERIISIAKQLLMENASLQGQVKSLQEQVRGLCERIASQSDALSKRAEVATPKKTR